jgi:hypothetical protein
MSSVRAKHSDSTLFGFQGLRPRAAARAMIRRVRAEPPGLQLALSIIILRLAHSDPGLVTPPVGLLHAAKALIGCVRFFTGIFI